MHQALQAEQVYKHLRIHVVKMCTVTFGVQQGMQVDAVNLHGLTCSQHAYKAHTSSQRCI